MRAVAPIPAAKTGVDASVRTSGGDAAPALRLFVVVVLYQMDLADSTTIASLVRSASELEGGTILLWDNGSMPQDPGAVDEFAVRTGCAVTYVHTPENRGLPAIYAAATERACDHDLVVLWDQDSVFSAEYFAHLRRATRAHPQCALFVPIVASHGRIVSPGNYRWIKGRYWRTPRSGLVRAAGLTAVNSGMAIRRAYLADEFGGHDPRFRFYGVDTYFMLDHARRREFAFVLPFEVQHASALLDPNATTSERLRRHAGLFEAWVMLHEASALRSVFARLYVLYVGVREAVRSRDLRFVTTAAAAAFVRRGR